MPVSQPLRSPDPTPVSPVSQAPPHLFCCSRRAESGRRIRLTLAGELDLAAADHFQAALVAAQADSRRVMLDLGALTLIDCAGLSLLFAAAARRPEEAALILLGPVGQVRRVFDLVGVPSGVAVLDPTDFRNHEGAKAA
jgi:anti-anti-sigma factor